MKFLIILIIFCQVCAHVQCFFANSVTSLFTSRRGNLTCLVQTIITYNGITTYRSGTGVISINNANPSSNYMSPADYCVIYEITQIRNGLLEVQTSWTLISIINEFRNIAINRCGFSGSMDIGYGNCSNLPYETPSTTTFLCICSTSNCSDTSASCRASVDQAQLSPPALLPTIIPLLNNPISCSGFTVCDSFVIKNSISAFNDTACNTYAASHTRMCLIQYVNVTGGTMTMGIVDGSYELFLKYAAINAALAKVNMLSDTSYYEGPTSMMFIGPYSMIGFSMSSTHNGNASSISISDTDPTAQCYCTTSNCNVNLDTCASGLNYSSSMLMINQNTSQIPTTTPRPMTSISSTTSSTYSSTTRMPNTTATTATTTTATTATTTTATSATTATTTQSSGGGCFSGDSQVKMSDGTYKNIAHLKIGDSTATPAESDIVLILDSQPSQRALFHTIKTESGKAISLSAHHLIATRLSMDHTSKVIYKFAKDIKIHDILINEQSLPERVTNITIELKQGNFAPMSTSGNLIVNGLQVSCYANVPSHELAHLAMAPVRLYYTFLNKLGLQQNLYHEFGVHPIAAWMISWCERFLFK